MASAAHMQASTISFGHCITHLHLASFNGLYSENFERLYLDLITVAYFAGR